MISERMLEVLAVDLGLIIIAGWFYILLLMFREFQTVSSAVNRLTNSHLIQDLSLENKDPLADNELNLNETDSRKLDELIRINTKIEALFSTELVGKNKRLQLHKKEIAFLNQEIQKSNALIKKLKTNMRNHYGAQDELEESRRKLSKQQLVIKKLRIQSDKANIENDQLKQQIINHIKEIKQISEQGELYSQKLIEQGKELEYLKAKSQAEGNSKNAVDLNIQIETLQDKLSNSKEELQRISTEKDFLETQFLDILEQYEEEEDEN
ncbi:hypothetical protein [Psychromonas aquimarina]|uniref:hypothetical protein n=1 Tax=Psychromonas aquimarina TaxID=444919 RepID=UPI0003FDE0B6|nr:hypothetical protein [Psychromonas aquimarina]